MTRLGPGQAIGLALLVALVATGGTLPPASAQRGPAADAPAAAGPSSRGPDNHHILTAVDLDSASDGWAVGRWCGTGSGAECLTTARHWDGKRWNVVDTPNPGLGSMFLGVDAISPSDAWAVGGSADGSETFGPPLIEHWNGSSWDVFDTPFAHGQLQAVSSSGPDDVWAVGFFQTRTFRAVPLAEHWNGVRWRRTTGPRTGSSSFHSVEVLAPDDVWAVGTNVIEHWDGTQWSLVSSNLGDTRWNGVSAAAPDDVWVVGNAGSSAGQRAVAEHWDGVQWSQVHVPNGRGNHNAFESVRVVTGTDVWAVGDRGTWAVHQSKTLIEHWDGTRWTRVFSPNRQRLLDGYDLNVLSSIASVSSDDAWAVGYFSPGSKTKPIIAHWDGASWTNFLVNKEPR